MAAGRLSEAAPAKVNLYLHVIGRQADGYHRLDSLVAFAGAEDFLHAEAAETLSLAVEGPFARALVGETDNLVVRAARALAAETGVSAGARLALEKHLPVASGIGGGSADAAAALRLLCRLWHVQPAALELLAGRLGADVPVCLAGRPSRMGGIGELLVPVAPLPDCGIALVNPGVALATGAVFQARQGPWSSAAALPDAWPDVAAMAADLRALRNDLEPPAMGLQPVIGDALAALAATPGCLLARMSGSGATCFGLYRDDGVAQQALAGLRRAGWWCWAGSLRSR